MDTDKAYLLGLVIGGGKFGNAEDIFRIILPYKQWGSYEKSPDVVSQIARDIFNVVSPLFRAIYGITISYETTKSGIWNILCEGDLSELLEDLRHYDIKCVGEIRKHVDISKLTVDLVDDNLKRRFIAGLADTIGSTKPSHRRFNDDSQMISFEISGFDFGFVCSLCKLLHSIGCYPDQILWNHPNFHSANNPYYKQWAKGFKLRVALDQYEKFGAFAFTSKTISAKQNKRLEKRENVAKPCNEHEIRKPSVSCVHCDEHSMNLPEIIRNGHYLHNRHVCAVQQCEHAPYMAVGKLIEEAQYYINPFPVLYKGTLEEVNALINAHNIYKNRSYKDMDYPIKQLYDLSKYKENQFLFSDKDDTGYPLNKIVLGIVYLISAKNGQVKGSRPKGSKDSIISSFLNMNPNAKVKIRVPNILTPIVMILDNHAVMIVAQNPDVYKKLIAIDENNKYKMHVREIDEADFDEEK